jgi:hypothetical protein
MVIVAADIGDHVGGQELGIRHDEVFRITVRSQHLPIHTRRNREIAVVRVERTRERDVIAVGKVAVENRARAKLSARVAVDRPHAGHNRHAFED